MPHHTADTFNRYTLRQAQLRDERVPTLMEGNRFVNLAMSGNNFQRVVDSSVSQYGKDKVFLCQSSVFFQNLYGNIQQLYMERNARFWRDMQIHRLPSSSVTMSFHVSFFKSTYEMPVNEAKTNKSRMKHWLCDSNGVEISRSNSSLVSKRI